MPNFRKGEMEWWNNSIKDQRFQQLGDIGVIENKSTNGLQTNKMRLCLVKDGCNGVSIILTIVKMTKQSIPNGLAE